MAETTASELGGLRRKLRNGIARARRWAYSRRVELILAGAVDSRRASKPGTLLLRKIEAHHQGVLGELNPEDARKFENYLRNGYQGFIAFAGERPIGHIWYVDNQVPSDLAHPVLERYRLDLADDEVYIYEFLILSDARGKGVANQFFAGVLAELRARGYSRAYGYVDPSNTPARWTYQLFGFETIDARVSHCFCEALLWDDGRLYVHPVLYGLLHPTTWTRTFDFMPVLAMPARLRRESSRSERRPASVGAR
jgi:ribosomal protein S18 acetylase RimI-like enzyme